MQLFQLVKLAKLVTYKVESSFVQSKQDFHTKFKLLSYLIRFCIFSLETKVKICKIYMTFPVFCANGQCYIAEVGMVPKLKC